MNSRLAPGNHARAVGFIILSLMPVPRISMGTGGRAHDVGIRANSLYSAKIAAPEGGEYVVEMQAQALGTSWEIPGKECAVLQLIVDGKYDQHIFLFHGGRSSVYAFLLGPLAQGEHTLEITWDRSWARDLDDSPNIERVTLRQLDGPNAEREAILHAPVLHLRKDTIGLFSDVPLLVYWESQPEGDATRITYTVIFSNEDGGTREDQLMARWGRTTDIEWCFSYVKGEDLTLEYFQGRNHSKLPFRGSHEGKHAVLFDATPNNTFADLLLDPAPVRVRMVPIAVSLQNVARESVMDRYPWTYAIMARELEREGKTEEPPDPVTEKTSDPRNYAYLEACATQRGTEIYFEIEIKGQSRWYASDHSNPESRIDRSGCFRSAVELPRDTRIGDLQRLRIYCLPAPVPADEKPVPSPSVELVSLNRVFLLSPEYEPGRNLLESKINRKLKPGNSLTLDFPR